MTLKLRYSDFTTITRSHTQDPATRDASAVVDRAIALLEKTEAGRRRVRLLGVSTHGLGTSPSPPADEAEELLPLA